LAILVILTIFWWS